MEEYEQVETCRMAFLQRALDDDTAAPCGRCDRCAAPWYATEVPEGARTRVDTRLHRVGVEIQPRSQWPSGMARLGVPLSGRIAPDERADTGRALARLTDLGWGHRLRQVLAADDAPVESSVLQACLEALHDWGWEQRPTAVVAMPSRRHPVLVESVAREIAQAGRLPLLGTLDVVDGGPTGDPGGNSAFRVAGVWQRHLVGAPLAAALDTSSGPVLLVDDLCDSRWTITLAARELRRAGADAVLPFVLAQAG
jgi:ATP-dependent DNA helicase RecQ